MALSPVERRAAFVDRDGVLVAERADGRPPVALELLPSVARSLARLNEGGWLVVVVTNQPAVARGWCTEDDVRRFHDQMADRLAEVGGRVDRFCFCPHHPEATLPEYRMACHCRKPAPGMLTAAADALGVDLATSVMIGDRMTDVEAGVRAGCGSTFLVESQYHEQPRISTPLAPLEVEPDHRVADLSAAVALMIGTADPATVTR